MKETWTIFLSECQLCLSLWHKRYIQILSAAYRVRLNVFLWWLRHCFINTGHTSLTSGD